MWKVFEGFAGYGGAAFGLKRSGVPHQIVGFSEINQFSIELYQANHAGHKNFGDITKIRADELPDFDFFTGGFPCQAFSSAGLGKGELDTRGTLFHDILRICEARRPRRVLLENVKGLLSKRHLPTLEKILGELQRLGYAVKYELLNSKDYGVPQNRERVWIFATLDLLPKSWSLAPEVVAPTPHLAEFLDSVVPSSYYKSRRQVERLEEVTGVDLAVKGPLCFDVYNRKVRHDGLCITITEPHHNSMRIVDTDEDGKGTIRKLTEREHFRLMGFRDGEIDFAGQSYNQLCRAAGNGWDVNVVARIFERIHALEEGRWIEPKHAGEQLALI
jgi:DNA (cytosine-5)-methyltransferase 1